MSSGSNSTDESELYHSILSFKTYRSSTDLANQLTLKCQKISLHLQRNKNIVYQLDKISYIDPLPLSILKEIQSDPIQLDFKNKIFLILQWDVQFQNYNGTQSIHISPTNNCIYLQLKYVHNHEPLVVVIFFFQRIYPGYKRGKV